MGRRFPWGQNRTQGPYASTPKNAPTMPTAMVATISTMGLIFLDSSQ